MVSGFVFVVLGDRRTGTLTGVRPCSERLHSERLNFLGLGLSSTHAFRQTGSRWDLGRWDVGTWDLGLDVLTLGSSHHFPIGNRPIGNWPLALGADCRMRNADDTINGPCVTENRAEK